MAIPSISDARNLQQVQTTVNQLVRQFDNTGQFTLANGATQTVVKNPKITSLSVISSPIPRTQAAATEAVWIVSIGTGQFIVGHSNATTTRTFDYVIHGV